ncbi:TIGR04222 domain-containing membrane protein [Tahibacter amnicola]|uniref:TIGR04222 domain-containing membrane protein n=1 Tax=Tahibacter amnicola TaxID=2976241 RepID=A0ABY6BK21_9GAMM|nr:TIGR04222 domain-containing membrane protein [Tahibacter amnicola]UXI70369.1 TIGR04222 domain-containing membrane protein [Tahibacter amnicola]
MSSIGLDWPADHQALWQRIAAHDFGTRGDALDFPARLAREHGWSRSHAEQAIEEYRRFCFLAVVAPDPVTPSDVVDEVWHLHLTYSRDYWETFCPCVLGKSLHHQPTRGGRDEDHKHYRQYADTLASYQAWFGAPPAEFWPGAQEAFRSAAAYRRVDMRRVVLLPRPRWPRAQTLWRATAALAALAIAPLLQAAELNPLELTGPEFLGLYLVLAIVCAIVSKVLRRNARDMRASSSSPNLDAWSVAYLAGGPTRVADAAVAELMSRQQAHWSDQTRTVVVHDARAISEYPLDVVAHELGKGTALHALPAAITPALARIEQSLVQRKLLVPEPQRKRVALLGALPFIALMGLGMAKIAVGISRDRPVGFLIVLVIVTAIAALVLFLNRPWTATAGDAALKQLRQRHAHATRAPRDRDVGLAVALAGTAVLAGTAYAAYHDVRAPASSSSSSSDSSSGCSSSGDSDSGGGGCGGCGGGGGD